MQLSFQKTATNIPYIHTLIVFCNYRRQTKYYIKYSSHSVYESLEQQNASLLLFFFASYIRWNAAKFQTASWSASFDHLIGSLSTKGRYLFSSFCSGSQTNCISGKFFALNIQCNAAKFSKECNLLCIVQPSDWFSEHQRAVLIR